MEATTTARTRALERSGMRMRFALKMLGLAATVAILAFMLVPAAEASPSGSLKPILTRVQLHDGRLWTKRSKRSKGLHAGSLRARAAIVGGSRISIAQAPWQVIVIAFISETEAFLCGGSILNETEVLTAGHCLYNPFSKEWIASENVLIGAGTENINIEPEQVRLASGVRAHPYYNPEASLPAPDDVAVLRLKTPLIFNPDVQPIGLISADSLLPEGTAVGLTGFGRENPSTPLNGELYAIGMTLRFSGYCGGKANALFLCASASNGSLCFGDSGSGLTLPGAPATLAGVTNAVEVINGKPCLAGSVGGFANLAAPEIRDFVLEGNESPPRAPQGGGVTIRGIPVVGEALSCEPGVWTNSPTFSYVFMDGGSGVVMQQGASPAFTLTAADVGRSVLCQVLAANAGGTGVARTAMLGPVRHNQQEEEAAARQRRAEEEAAALKKRQEEEAAQRSLEEESRQLKKATEEAAAKHEAEAAAKRHEEEIAAAGSHTGGAGVKGGVLGTEEVGKSTSRSPRSGPLAKALGLCKKRYPQSKRKRARCEARARRRYGSKRAAAKR